LLAALHRAPAVDAAWSPFADIERYARIAADEGLAPPDDARDLLGVGRRIERIFAELGEAPVLCHNDLQPQNLIDDGEQLWLLDWEYAGMGARYFDLGNLACNADLSEAELDRLLPSYRGDVPLEVERARAMLMRVVSGIREAYWAVVAEPVLDNDWDYGAWAESFFDRCRRTAQSAEYEDWLELAVRT
jgi:thiamine kinase-like enzyme